MLPRSLTPPEALMKTLFFVILAGSFVFTAQANANNGFELPSEAELSKCDNVVESTYPGNIFTCSTRYQSWTFKAKEDVYCLVHGPFKRIDNRAFVSIENRDDLFQSIHIKTYPGVAPGLSFHLVQTKTKIGWRAIGYAYNWSATVKPNSIQPTEPQKVECK